MSTQVNTYVEFKNEMRNIASNYPEVLVLDKCPGKFNNSLRCFGKQKYLYPEVLRKATFCLVFR